MCYELSWRGSGPVLMPEGSSPDPSPRPVRFSPGTTKNPACQGRCVPAPADSGLTPLGFSPAPHANEAAGPKQGFQNFEGVGARTGTECIATSALEAPGTLPDSAAFTAPPLPAPDASFPQPGPLRFRPSPFADRDALQQLHTSLQCLPRDLPNHRPLPPRRPQVQDLVRPKLGGGFP